MNAFAHLQALYTKSRILSTHNPKVLEEIKDSSKIFAILNFKNCKIRGWQIQNMGV